jgi:hypothetical protein
MRLLQACREALRKENLRVQWQQSNKRWVAIFYFPRHDESLHVIPGDELILQHSTGVFPEVGQSQCLWFALVTCVCSAVYCHFYFEMLG